MDTTVNVGHKASAVLLFLDQHGNPMLGETVPDFSPTWSNSPGSPPVDVLKTSADGLSAEIDAIAEGQDVLGVTVVVGGKSFSASVGITVSPEPQVLSGVAIVLAVG
jgi:hypothetical protein